MTQFVTIIGGGLAGSEAAWQLARHGIPVCLYEMRPLRSTEAHRTDGFAELVCSNSLRSASLEAAIGLLKEEMRRLGSLIMAAADATRVPAGLALAVDRDLFSRYITAALTTHPLIEVRREEVQTLPSDVTVVASGPLTSPALSAELRALFGSEYLYFYDAISPVIMAESINMDVVFRASRYDHGGDDYLNCPLTRDEYYHLIDEILAAEKMPEKDFERCLYFEGCLPVEEMARRGKDTLAFGPMKPVGLIDPRTGERPYAVVQLRQDDKAGTLWGMVGFQTKMTYPEQRRVFRTIPGLEKAEFVRLGSLHRNTFIDSPRLLKPTLQFKGREDLFFAGQMIGVEGYLESAAAGLFAGLNAGRLMRDEPLLIAPPTTALGSMLAYVTSDERRDFQPMNTNYGLFPPLARKLRGREKKAALAERALRDLTAWQTANGLLSFSASALPLADSAPSQFAV
ncbi:MAG TPA: methylenetetrahydrofolate--tRNA-(uracil(54)-C(5))-methyltransferase (FADH(2)-oxidizing) TrmFO [Methylomirabilota bacterium]|nr:methylenetetrahydrofolate--tRNA-(uracil(54)-C(5))-methyltransferase (FADH(2)-oxidizing) TrmFO [Methylomirabilota bacterium]